MSKALCMLGITDSERKGGGGENPNPKKTIHKTKPKHKLGNERGREAFSEGKLEAVSPAKQHMFYGVTKFPWLIQGKKNMKGHLFSSSLI